MIENMRLGQVDMTLSRRPIHATRVAVDGMAHNLAIAAGKALIDSHGLVRWFEQSWDDGFVGQYILHVKNNPHGDEIKSIESFVATFGLCMIGGKLVQATSKRLNLNAPEHVESLISFAFNDKVSARIATWLVDHINAPSYVGYFNAATGRLIYPGGPLQG